MASTERIDEADVLGVFGRRDTSVEPLTVGDVVDAVGCDDEAARDRLRSLTEQGRLDSKQIGGHTRVWWQPPSAGGRPGSAASGTTRGATRDRVEQILEAGPVSVVVVEPSGTISFANSRAEEVLGLDRGEITDRTYEHSGWEIYHDDGTPVPSDEHPVTHVLETGEPVYGFEHRIRRPDGTERWLSSSSAPVSNGDGEVEYVVVGFEDTTPLKNRERCLERSNRFNTVIRTIQRTVARAGTREEVAKTVCETLLEFDEYHLSVVGELSASFEEMLETDSGPPLSTEIAATATRTGELQVRQDISDLSEGYWHDVATVHGIRSYAAVPIVHEGSVSGVIGLYADRANAFDEHEQRVLSELGAVVGSALSVIERNETRNPTTELVVRSDRIAASVIGDTAQGEFTLESAVTLSDDRQIRYWTVDGISPDTFADRTIELPGVLDVQLLSRAGDTSRFEVLVDAESLASSFHRLDGELQSVVVEDGSSFLSLEFEKGVDAGRVLELIRETYPDAELVSQRRILTESYYRQVFDATLTDRQQTVLQMAYFSGYFDSPRKQTGDELAERLGITRQTFHVHLRKAQARILRQLLADPA
jgi:PAS domain S-box-containing protein